jgi:hypothetical protein
MVAPTYRLAVSGHRIWPQTAKSDARDRDGIHRR